MGLIILVVSLFTSFAVIVAHMLLDTCSIRYITFGGDEIIEEVVRGTRVTLDNNITRDGYDFVGWTVGETNDIVNEIVVKNDTVLIANWKVVEHSIYYNGVEYVVYNKTNLTHNGNTISFKTIDGNMVTLCGADNYNWNITVDGSMNGVEEDISLDYARAKSFTLSQVYSGVYYDITFSEDISYSISALDTRIKSGDNAVFQVELQEGYTNSSIRLDGVDYSAVCIREGVYVVTVFDVDQDMHIDILGVEKNIYRVLLDFDGGVVYRSLNEMQIQYGERLYLPTPIKVGYRFSYWVDTKTSIVVDTPDIAIMKDMTLKAIYTLENYAIELPISSSGSYVTTYNGEAITSVNQVCYATIEDTFSFSLKISEMYDTSSVKLYYMIDDVRVDIPSVIVLDTVSVSMSGVSTNMAVMVDTIDIRKYNITIDYLGGMDSKGASVVEYSLHYGSLIMVESNSLKMVDYIDGVTMSIENVSKLGSKFINFMYGENILTSSSIQSFGKGSVIVSARWELVESVITMSTNGGMFEDGDTRKTMLVVDYSDTLVPTKTGYTFVGWFTKLVEINGQIDYTLSVRLDITGGVQEIVAYAGWVQNN